MSIFYSTAISISADVKYYDTSEFSNSYKERVLTKSLTFPSAECRCFTKAKSIQEVEWSFCKCELKFPEKETSFSAAQKFSRSGTIDGIDYKGTKLFLNTVWELQDFSTVVAQI